MKKQKMVSLVLAGLVMFSGMSSGFINGADAQAVTTSGTKQTSTTAKKPSTKPTTTTKTSSSKTTTKKATKKTPTRTKRKASRGSATGQDVVNFAKQQLGKPYVWGAAGPKSFDCSGFTMYVYSNFGVSLPHSSSAQSNYGTTVSKSGLRPGDLLFFKTEGSSRINHVGIYVGNDQFIHGSSGKGKVYISDFSDYTSRQVFVTAKRHF